MRLSGVDLNLLPALDALLSERNVTRAGERLSVGQPAMSASLARLRKHFGDPLLVREGVTNRLTPLAESLVEPVRRALEATAAALDAGRPLRPESLIRSFTFMASDYVLLVLLKQMIATVSALAPGIKLRIEPISPGYRDLLRHGHTDFLIMPAETPGRNLGFPSRRLFTDRHVLVGDAGNPAVAGTPSLEEFLSLPFADYGGPLASVVASHLDALGVERRIAVETQSFTALPLLLRGTPYVALLQRRLALMTAPGAGLRITEPPIGLAPLHEMLHWHPRQTSDPAHRWLRELLCTLSSQLATDQVEPSLRPMDDIDKNN